MSLLFYIVVISIGYLNYENTLLKDEGVDTDELSIKEKERKIKELKKSLPITYKISVFLYEMSFIFLIAILILAILFGKNTTANLILFN